MARSAEQQYLDLLTDIRDNGDDKGDRTGTGARSVFGPQMEYDLREGFPLLTTKKIALGTVATELCWMLKGDRNLRYLVERNCNIWNEWPFVNYLYETGQPIPPQDSEEWKGAMAEYVHNIKTDDNFAEEFGDLGPVYGYQWRHCPDGTANGIDQLAIAQDTIRYNPNSRRNIVSAWNVSEIDAMSKSGLPPCHMMYQFYVSSKGELDMKMYQRSADTFLGVPFNMAQYAMLLTMMAQTTDTTPRRLVHTFGDTHIYNNHFDQVNTQLEREPYAAPTINLNPNVTEIWDFEPEDITIAGYEHHPAIRAQVAI
ncbi:MAG: thymidylate synthase [Candidatus Saccharimonas sp.]